MCESFIEISADIRAALRTKSLGKHLPPHLAFIATPAQTSLICEAFQLSCAVLAEISQKKKRKRIVLRDSLGIAIHHTYFSGSRFSQSMLRSVFSFPYNVTSLAFIHREECPSLLSHSPRGINCFGVLKLTVQEVSHHLLFLVPLDFPKVNVYSYSTT